MSVTRFFLDSHGCAKNQVDGEEIAARLECAGYEWAPSAESADVIIVNSCGFIESAKKESIDAVLGWKAGYPGKKVILAGCLAQRYATELTEGLPEADGIVGNSVLADVPTAVAEVMSGRRPIVARDPEAWKTGEGSGGEAMRHQAPIRRRRLLDFAGTAHVKITEGCSNRCTYCAIPLIRGSLRSRAIADIVDECADLVAAGAKELVLIGQDLGSFGKDSGGESLLPELFEALCGIEAPFRVRTLYIHPDNFPEAILPLMRAHPRLLPYFDLPFQHASAPILKAMNRRGSDEAYLGLIERIRTALPEAVIRSTFLVGFPGETEEDFRRLRAFQDAARLDWLGAFTYSREEGTPAFSMRGRVPKKVAEARKKAVEEAQEAITSARLARFVGSELEVLVEEIVETPEGQNPEEAEELSLGRAWLQAPDVDGLVVLRGRRNPGDLVRAKVLAVNGVDFDAIAITT